MPYAARARWILTILLFGAAWSGAACDDREDAAPTARTIFERKPHSMNDHLDRLAYPPARIVDVTDDYHGTPVADPYRWLEDLDSDETRAWIAAQNALTESFLSTIPAREHYLRRLTELWNYERHSAPIREGGRLFFQRNDGLQPQPVLWVQDGPQAEPRVLLDPNALSRDGTVALGAIEVSRDGRRLAWSTNVGGSDWRTWRVRDVDTGDDLPDVVEWSKFSGAAWDESGDGFYYSRYDAPAPGSALEAVNDFHKLYYHRVGTSQRDDVLVYERPDRKDWGFDAEVSDDGRYLVINVWRGSSRNNGLFYRDLAVPDGPVVALLDAFDASYVFVGNEGPVFFLHTNLEAPRGRIVAVDIRDPAERSWRTLVPQTDDPIEDATILNHSFVVTYMQDVKHAVRIHALSGEPLGSVDLPGPGSVTGFHGRPQDTATHYLFTSFLNPGEIHHLDLTTGVSTLWRAPRLDFDFSRYVARQVFYFSQDGTRIPMFLVHRRDLRHDGSHPTLLYGYGGFNAALTPSFSAGRLPWLEQGGIWAVASVRGGGEYGETWHRAGMLESKQNTFDDFIAGAEYLIEEGYTSPDRLAIHGASNGGLLVGAVVNQRPELFAAALPAVGVMDMLRFQHWTIGWAWTSDYGSSEDPALFPVLHAYSPYHNIRSGVAYPAVFVTTADRDDRVVPAHSFKYTARLQAAQDGPLPILIRVETRAGHGAGKPTQKLIEEHADRYTFLHHVLQMGD
ncbi:MAG: prolyl oligopeptidase family serine peptidase [Candidatus Krumholzibacteriia bacterium]